MSTHTPGPWPISDGEILGGGEILGVVYRTEGWSSGDPVENEDQANARLISAAPDMLEALKAAASTMAAHNKDYPKCPYDFGEGWGGTLDMCLAAIAKAEGTP